MRPDPTRSVWPRGLVVLLGLAIGCRGVGEPAPASPAVAVAEESAPAPPAPAAVDPAVAVAVGDGFGCALRRSGALWCWGAHPVTDDLPGDRAVRSLPEQVATVDPDARLVAASDALCAWRPSGEVRCWSALSHFMEADPAPRMALVGLDMGGVGTCGVSPEGGVACWNGGLLQLDRDAPREGVLDVAVLPSSGACAARGAAPVVCWPPRPRPSYGGGVTLGGEGVDEVEGSEGATRVSGSCLLRDGRVGCFDAADLAPLSIGWLEGMDDAEAIAAVRDRVCALRQEGTVACRALDDPEARWQEVPALTEATALAVGEGHACALRADGSVSCWGEDGRGQLGDGAASAVAAPGVAVPGLLASDLGLGGDHACAVQDGRVRCWGDGRRGQLGGPNRRVHASPVEIPGILDAVEVESGDLSTCARHADGGVSCWGGTTSGPVTRLPGVDDAAALAVGSSGRVCVRHQSGATSCWRHGTRHHVAGLSEIVHLAVGERQLCATRAGSGVSCTPIFVADRSSPALALEGLGPVDDLDAHGDRFCALSGDLVSCWRIRRNEVVLRAQLRLGEPATSVAVGGSGGICALGRSGSVWCGRTSGEATRVEGLDAVVALDGGASHHSAQRRDGSTRCWGSNARGQLGDGTGGPVEVPVGVLGLP